MENSLQVLRFDEIPSAEEFASQIEPKNVPAVFTGYLKNWKVISKWNVSNGGLDYLEYKRPFDETRLFDYEDMDFVCQRELCVSEECEN